MEKIIEKLKNYRMRPKWHFVIKSALLVISIFLVLLLTLFLTSFLLFYLARSGIFFAPVPFVLLLLSIVFIAVAEFLITRYAVAYKKPVIYSLIIIVVLVFMLGSAINKARFHERMEKRNILGVRKIYNVPKRIPQIPSPMPGREINIKKKLY